MLLVLDIGNTNTVMGIFRGDDLVGHWRLSTSDRTSDELGLTACDFLRSRSFSLSEVGGAIIASVVPKYEELWADAIRSWIGVEPVIVRHGMRTGIEIDLDDPSELGADRLVNAAAGKAKYGAPLVIVDLGTAITLDVISRGGAYIGGAIAPGLSVSTETLFRRTAKLPQIPLVAPDRAIGRGTKTAIQSGIVYGFVGLVDALAERIFDELGERVKVIATGGHAAIIAPHSRTITAVDQWLTLDGLKLLYGLACEG